MHCTFSKKSICRQWSQWKFLTKRLRFYRAQSFSPFATQPAFYQGNRGHRSSRLHTESISPRCRAAVDHEEEVRHWLEPGARDVRAERTCLAKTWFATGRETELSRIRRLIAGE